MPIDAFDHLIKCYRVIKMDDDIINIAAIAAYCAFTYYNFVNIYFKKKVMKPWKRRRCWMKTIHRSRTKDTMENQMVELFQNPTEGEFDNFTRISYEDFQYLLNKISPIISKKDTRLRESIPAKIRLAITMRFLATGDSYKSLHYLFKISSELISKIIPEVCGALNEILKDQVKLPSTPEEWLDIGKGFENKFPHACGAIDGKHVVLLCPPHSGSDFFNYKKTFSIVLFALVDSNYQFMFADIGCQGRISDGGVFQNSLLWQYICQNKLNLPPSCPLPGSKTDVPYVFLGDGAFPLTTNIMKPYPGNHEVGSLKRIFNESLSSSRVIVENTFGILSSKFRVFKKPFDLNPEKVTTITLTCILLHNFLRRSKTSHHLYTPPGTVDTFANNGNLIQRGNWRDEIRTDNAIRPLPPVSRKPALKAAQIRDEFAMYFYNKSLK